MILFGIQFIRPAHNASLKKSDRGLSSLYEVPDSISFLLEVACNDCHSNNTHYPWYSELEPFGWILDHHIRKGKAELNFDEIADYSARKRKSKFKAAANQVRDGLMPIPSYTWMHKDARLTNAQKQMLINWFTK